MKILSRMQRVMKLLMTKNLCDFTVIHDHCSVEKALDKVKSIPNPIVRLERFYDLEYKLKSVPNFKNNSSQMKYETVNLGTELNPQIVNLRIDCTPIEK